MEFTKLVVIIKVHIYIYIYIYIINDLSFDVEPIHDLIKHTKEVRQQV